MLVAAGRLALVHAPLGHSCATAFVGGEALIVLECVLAALITFAGVVVAGADAAIGLPPLVGGWADWGVAGVEC